MVLRDRGFLSLSPAKIRPIATFHLSYLQYGILNAVLVLSISLSFFKSTNVRLIYTDLLKGKAAAFDRENYERYDLLSTSKESVVYLPAIQTQPGSLFVEDIKSDPKHWWNKCMAGYFGKKIIYLKEDQSEQK